MRSKPTIRPGCAALALCCAALWFGPQTARAQRIVHRVRFGEKLADIAKRYYGTPKHAKLLATVNGLAAKGTLDAGLRVRVPTAWTYTLRRRRRISEALARRLIKHSRCAEKRPGTCHLPLEQLNGIRHKKRVKRGKTLVVPFVLTHVAAAGERFADLAKRYYGGNTKRAKLISEFNRLKGAAPAAGTEIEIPIAHVRITRRRLQQLTRERVLGISPRSLDENRAALQEANAMLRRGAYWRVALRLVRMLAREQPSDSHIAKVYKLLATAYVAVGQHALAVRAFKEALLRQPTLKLDPVTESPKVIRAFVDAKSAASSSK